MTERSSGRAPHRITVLAGGIGAARFLVGLRRHLQGRPDTEVRVIGNTADDITLHGLHISPDLDTVMYTLGGGIHPGQGWGRDDETFSVAAELAAYRAEPQWFTLGDRDIATHILRTQMLAAGYSLTQVTEALCARWLADSQPPVRLLPMCDDRVETHVVTDLGDGPRAIHFQEWWTRYRAEPRAERIVLVGMDRATAPDGVLSAIADADVILLPPSNPVVSIGPILGVPGVRDALRDATAPVVGISPIIGGAPVRGMADACLAAIGVATSAASVAGLYADFLDGWLVDRADVDALPEIEQSGVAARALGLLMTDELESARIAAEALAMALEVSR